MSLDVDEDEHSIEMHLPYIAYRMPSKKNSFTIVPILVGSLSYSNEEVYGKILAPYLADTNNLFIISSDFCHWGSRFSFTYRYPTQNSSTPIFKQIEEMDKEGMSFIERLDVKGFKQYLKSTRNTICGRHPIGVLLNAIVQCSPSWENINIKFVKYAQSNQVKHEKESSVSYASAYLSASLKK